MMVIEAEWRMAAESAWLKNAKNSIQGLQIMNTAVTYLGSLLKADL
jgi:hypothetical protein